MTTPSSAWNAITPADEQDALHGVSQMLTGTKMLQDEPGVVYSLAAQKANPADAQAVDQFMQSLDAEKQVSIARASGEQIRLTPNQQALLTQNGVNYNDVLWTDAKAAQQTQQQILKASHGQQKAKTNPDGSLALDSNGDVQVEDIHPQKSSGGGGGGGSIFDSIRHFFNPVSRYESPKVPTPVVHVGHDLKNWLYEDTGASSAMGDIGKGLNLVNAGLHSGPDKAGFSNFYNPQSNLTSGTSAEDMQAQGYDPTSFFSTIAFDASGRKHTDLSSLETTYGQDAVDEGLKFLTNPKAYRKSIEADPASYTKDATGQTALTPEAEAKLKHLASKPFETMIRQINARSATVGNDLANSLGIDPVKHAADYNDLASATNVAVSFAIDPSLIALNSAKVAKLSQIGINTLGDNIGAAAVLTRSGRYARNVQRGWQRAIDLGGQMRAADDAGDTVKLASLTGQFNAELPGLAPLMPEFIGKNALTGWRDPTVAERASGLKYVPVRGDTGGIKTLDQAAEFVKDKYGLSLLQNGRAATQSGLMPGALSAFGYRKLKGLSASWMTARSATRAEQDVNAVISRAEADPLGLGQKLVDEGFLERSPAEANDAVDAHSNSVIAYKASKDASTALGSLMGLMREGASATGERQSLADELDSLEAKLQAATADATTTPEQLADLHDSIAKGRQLIEASDAGIAASAAQVKAAQAALTRADAILNAPEAEAKATGLASQQRAFSATYAGRGAIARNVRSTGDVLGVVGRFGWASPEAIAARSRLAAQRFTTLLPRNTQLDLYDPATGDKIYKMALTYLNRGDANALRAAYNVGDNGARKTIITGMIDQLGHASGMGKSAAGKALLDSATTATERYSAAGDDNEILLNGQPMGLLEGQTRTTWNVPSFRDWQQASAKIGLWESTLGRALTSDEADMLMSQWKMGALFKPSTVTRNQLEGWLRTALDGRAGAAVKAKALATARNKELWGRGVGQDAKNLFVAQRGQVEGLDKMLAAKGLSSEQRANAYAQRLEAKRLMGTVENHPIVQHLLATEKGDAKLAAEIENGSMLSGEVLGRSTPTHALANLAPLAWVGRSYRSLVGRHMDAETVEAMLTLTPEELTQAMEGYGQQLMSADLGFKHAANEATEIAKAGWGPSKIRVSVHRQQSRATGGSGSHREWTHQSLDDSIGADRYVNALHQRVDAMPLTAKAALGHIEDPEGVPLSEVVSAMEQEKKLSGFGSVYFENPISDPSKARRAVTPQEVALGKSDWAQKVVNEYHHLLAGRNGVYQQELADYIKTTGTAPDADWIVSHMKGDNRPATALAPEVMAQPSGGIKSLPTAFQDLEGGAFQWLVERPLQRTTSSPVFLANYAIARKGLNSQVEQMVEGGLSRETAEAMAKDLSIKNAWVKTEQLIDDPGQKTQFDVIARNMFPFARATQAMVRRWGTGLWQNPVAARKLMLAYEGAVHSGLIYQNAYGEPTYTYPASGVMNLAMRGISKLPGFENVAQFPIAGDMTGGVLMSVPGADNPFRMSMGPMVSIPFREVYKHLLPTSWQGDLTKLDSFINGPIGTGETASQLVPTALRHYFANVTADDRNSALASAMNGAFANLAAAGLIPPTNASPAQLQQFRARLQTQVHNQLIVRFVFGLFAPASPSAPSESTSASGADFAWSIDGIKGLSDEYKKILDETGGDVGQATAVFTALHPDEVVYDPNGKAVFTKTPASAYETARSGMTAAGSYVPATDKALQWMTTNKSFIEKYPTVAAYFLPGESTGEPFSDSAYKTQIELGLRLRKTPQAFMNDVYVKHAEGLFYPTVQEYDRRINDAKASGDTALANQLAQSKSDWEKQYKAINPMFKAKQEDYGQSRATAIGQLADLRQMTTEGSVPDALGSKLKQLLSTWDDYETFVNSHRGADDLAKRQRSDALDMFNRWAVKALSGSPLTDVYNGVFRVLNTNLTKI